MTTRDEFLKNAKFHMSVDDRFRPVFNGTMFDKTGNAPLHSLSQHVPLEDLADAIKFCALGEGDFRTKISFGNDSRSLSPDPS